jgi:hypothetical protein
MNLPEVDIHLRRIGEIRKFYWAVFSTRCKIKQAISISNTGE